MAKQQTNELPDYHEFYVSSALYTVYDLKQDEKDKVFMTLFNMTPIDSYCIDCAANSVFTTDDNRPHKNQGHGMTYLINNANEWYVNLLTTYSIIQKEFICSRDPNHKLIFVIQLKNGKLSKIGQTPALADIAEQDIRKFKKVLGDNHYHEFSKAIGLFAHGVGVGSIVYLRRIIENFVIKPAYELAKARANWDDNEYQKSRMKLKIELLKSDLPDFLVNNTVIYAIISKGIHELTENECREYFPVLKTCLEFVLTDLEAKRETEQKRKEMHETLSKIAGRIK
jgi:hypothetical protein